MKKSKKWIALALAMGMALGVFSGCGKDNGKQADTSPSPSVSPSAVSSPTASAEQSVRDQNAAKEKVKISMVLCDAGLTIPEGLDLSNNDWSNLIADIANVELSIEQPLYNDYDQKLELRLSANDLPDIVHCIGSSLGSAKKTALDGAFLSLNDYYKNSVNVKNVVNEEQMTWAASSDGNFYNVPMSMLARPSGQWIAGRWDLVSKYNDGKWPETVPEWIDLLNKIKTEMPDALVISNRMLKVDYALNYGGRVIYQLYGLTSAGGDVWDFDNQKAQSEFLTPEYRAASKVMRELYESGALDKEFATTEKWADNLKTKNIVLNCQPSDAITPLRPNYADFPEGNSQIWRMAAPLKEFPAEVRYPEVAYGTPSTGIASHGLFISARCKTPDRAWDVIEALASEEVRDFCVWGKEGETFEMKDGERVPLPERASLPADDPKFFGWQRQFLVIWGFWERDIYNFETAKLKDAEYAQEQKASIQPIVEASSKVKKTPLVLPYTRSENASRKLAESKATMSTTTINYIMGRISDADFDKAIADWEKTYGFIAEEQTEFINSYDRSKAESLGVSYTLK